MSLKHLIASLLIVFLMGSLSAQKYGHVNYKALMDTLDEARVINEQLNKYEKSLNEVGESMIQKFQMGYQKFQESLKMGSLTGTQQKQQQSDLEVEQTAIGTYQQSARESLEKRNGELLRPFLMRIDSTLKNFAKSEGFSAIFDSSMGIIISPSSEDLYQRLVAVLNKK